MSARDVVLVFAAWFLVAVLQLVAALASPPLGFLTGAALGGLVFLIFSFFAVEDAPRWLPMLVAVTASFTPVVIYIAASSEGGNLWLWGSPLACLAVSGLVTALRSREVRRCSLCDRKIAAGDVLFECPRCGLEVCDLGDCWIHTELRCRVCHSNQVRIFPPESSRWWDEQLGPRVRQGVCQVTHESSKKADLRACRNCGRLQSTSAWDWYNGECVSCRWTIPDLPPRLRAYQPEPEPVRRRR